MIKSTTGTNAKLSTDASHSMSITNHKPTMSRCLLSVAIASSLLLVGCGDDDNDIIVRNDTSVESIKSFNAAQIDEQISVDSTATPKAKCDIKIEKVTYPTVGAAGERTNATAALMLPSGDSTDCQGDRPILLYAHGTTTDKNYDFSQVGNSSNSGSGEANLIAANFAAQGYIVVAPNYAGYDDSKLDYHPYLVAEQQSTDMADALDSAREIIARQKRANDSDYVNIDDSGKLFISGYSQGGHVAMATARKLEQEGKSVTAIAPSSGPYALAAFGDAIFSGNVNIGATRFAPLLAEGMQKKYGNIYNSPTDVFQPDYASTQLPNLLSFAELVAANKLPEFALFEKNPQDNPVLNALPAIPADSFFALGFDDNNYLIKTDFRTAFITDAKAKPDNAYPTVMNGAMPAENPQNNMRKALKDNDLRGYIPQMPTLLCGGNQDPTVYYDLNTGLVATILQQANMATNANLNVTVFDVDVTNMADDSREGKSVLSLIGQASMNQWDANMVTGNIQSRFAQSLSFTSDSAIAQARAAGITDQAVLRRIAAAEVLSKYHGGLVSSACTQATREFFEQDFNRSNNNPI